MQVNMPQDLRTSQELRKKEDEGKINLNLGKAFQSAGKVKLERRRRPEPV